MHIFIIYRYWANLSSDPKRMHYLNMFFFTDLKELCRYYDLKPELVTPFLRKAKIYKTIMYVLLFGFTTTFYALTIRCLVVSYMTISIEYFLLLACPMALIDLFGYIWLGFSFLVNLLLAVLTMEFLILRATNVSNQLMNRFGQSVKPTLRDQLVPLKQRKDTLKILRTVNDIVKQFTVRDFDTKSL